MWLGIYAVVRFYLFLVPFSTDHLIVPVFLRCPSRGYGYDKHDS